MLPAMTFGYTHVTPFNPTDRREPRTSPGYEGFDERVTTMAQSPPNSIDEAMTDLFDINADGLPDVLVTMPGLYGGKHGVYFNGASGQANRSARRTMGVAGVLGENRRHITLDNPNLSPATSMATASST